MDRNTLLAIVLCLGVYSLWLSYQTSQMPAPQNNAMQQGAPADSTQMTQGYDAGYDAFGFETCSKLIMGRGWWQARSSNMNKCM